MEPDANKKLVELEAKVDAIYASVEKTWKYFMWTMIITVVVLILPLIGLVFVLPSFFSAYTQNLQDLGI
jgi:hypothetical protein